MKLLHLLIFLVYNYCVHSSNPSDLVVFTVATEATDGYNRFMQSANKYGYNVKVLGMGQKWDGGNTAQYAGGGHKVNLFREGLQKIQPSEKTLVMFVDSYDVVFTGDPEATVTEFKKFNAKVVFSAEDFCWPDNSLRDRYPVVSINEKRFLNSGGFIGYFGEIQKIVSHNPIGNQDDDQLYYTLIYLDEKLRNEFSMKLDTRGEIILNLNGALDDVRIKFKGSHSFLYNMKTGYSPIVVHGNGPIKDKFNSLANYLSDEWTPSSGCQSCDKGTISLKGLKDDDFPRVMIGIFVQAVNAFVEDFFQNMSQLSYPKQKINLFIHYMDEFHRKHVDDFVKEFGSLYNSVQVYDVGSLLTAWTARNAALEACLNANCQYYMAIDGSVQIENSNTLQLMIERNRSVIAPLMVRPGKTWSNFWGELGANGFYKRSDDYVELVQRERIGIWNVPYISDVYLIHVNRIPNLLGAYIYGDFDPDMAFCKATRDQGIFMYMDNQEYYGHLVNSENYKTDRLHNDLWMIFDNKYTWQRKYIHEEYAQALERETVNEQPCTDVYWIPIFSPVMCRHMIEEFEHFGQWSNGKNEDTRLQGGYENVPTVDIHTNQLDWEKHWLQFLKDFVAPVSAKLFPGFYTESRAIINFMVRYKPGEQDRLRPHHDSSTYTINVALNQPGKDYEGGGTRFIRYNCTVVDHKVGWMLVHPGRLTHYHEGLPTTGGTRYIMISFIDP